MRIIVRVRELRKHHNLTQEELARKLNISRQSLISLEQGRWLPSLPLALQLAQFFQTPIEKVVTFDSKMLQNNLHSPGESISQSPDTPHNFEFKKEASMPRDIMPLRELRDMRDELDRLFEQSMLTSSGSAVFPTINVRQDTENLYLEAHVPGFKEQDLDIDVADDVVTISGRTENSEDQKDSGYIRKEYSLRSFSRTIPLPVLVKSDGANAKLSQGVLIVTLPKVIEEKSKTKRLKPTSE